jgi:hypothetical protein
VPGGGILVCDWNRAGEVMYLACVTVNCAPVACSAFVLVCTVLLLYILITVQTGRQGTLQSGVQFISL